MSWLLCCLTGCSPKYPDFNSLQLGKQSEGELQKQFKDQTQQARREEKLATIHNDQLADLEARSERDSQVGTACRTVQKNAFGAFLDFLMFGNPEDHITSEGTWGWPYVCKQHGPCSGSCRPIPV